MLCGHIDWLTCNPNMAHFRFNMDLYLGVQDMNAACYHYHQHDAAHFQRMPDGPRSPVLLKSCSDRRFVGITYIVKQDSLAELLQAGL